VPGRYVTVDDYEPVAREHLPSDVYDYIAGGSGDERTLSDNLKAWSRWTIRPRMLRGIPNQGFDASVDLFGSQVSMPVLIAPWAYQTMCDPEGEVATARAAAAAGTIMVVSTTAAERLEDIAAAAAAPRPWWQLYIFTDRGFTSEVLSRVVAAGYRAIVWTVDFQTNGLRHRDTRSGFVMPVGLPEDELVYDAEISWNDLEWIRSRSGGVPVLIKGILTAEDARLAVEAGADAIVVSNHGGRQLDQAPATSVALPEIVDAVAGAIPVLVDGGIRRGVDVFKALALGARATLVGRPVAWGLAAEGRAGVEGVLQILRDELLNTMQLAGCDTISRIGPDLIAQRT
jgi:isopentenyl diphosphate isomerase/L-lactate dehydrogenase-like FMN-dependent dehydrogenase